MEAPASELEDSSIYPVPKRTTELPSPDIFRPELPSPDPFVLPESQVPGLNTIRHELSTPEPHWTPAELPSPPFTDPAGRRLSDLGNIKRSVSDVPRFCMNRRSEPPRLSIVTTQSSRPEYHHSKQATASSRNSKTYENINYDTPSRAHVGAHLPMVSGASSYSTGSSSVQSSLFDRSILDQKFPLEGRNDMVSPSSACSDLDLPPFDSSAFRSPTSHKEKICPVQNFSKPFAMALEQLPMATNISPSRRRPGLPMEDGMKAVCSPLDICQAAPNTPSTSCEKHIGLDTTATSKLTLTQQLVQDVIDGVISMHRQCISTHNPGTDRTMRIFGPNGYSTFECGLQVLKGLHMGIIPRSADAICALLQVALQFLSYVLSRGNHSWWSLSQSDLHDWSLAIEDKDERDSFTEAISILWVNWKSIQRRRPCASPHRTLQTPLRTPPFAADKAQQSSTLAGVQLALVSPLSNQLSFDQAFRDNPVVQICSRFLDEFECVDLEERNSLTLLYPPDRVRGAAENLDFMRANLILPLLRRDLFSSFRQDILMIEAQLERGFLYTVREVEVMLMHHVLQRDVTKETIDEFFKSVRIHCDKALSPDSETCRTRRYLIDLTQMKAISKELKKREIRKLLGQKATEIWDHPKPYRKVLTDSPVQSSLGGSVEARLRGIQPLSTTAEKSSLSRQKIQTWQQTPQRHEQIATGSKTQHHIPEGYRKETQGTREDVARFGRDADAAMNARR
ncbi:MAG: hypothetical protein Q9210_005397 [Variospora velana]